MPGTAALPAGGPGVLALEDAGGHTALLDSAALRIALQGTPTRLAVLSACNTAGSAAPPAAEPGLRDILGSRPPPAPPVASALAVAPALVDAGLPAVVAMQFAIPDVAALSFGRTLYSALARNAPIDAALMETRKALRVDPVSPQADWATPILYLQDVGDGLLWQPADAGSPAAASGDATADTSGPAPTRHGGIEFLGPTTIHGPVAGGDIGSLTMGDIYGAPPGPAPAAPTNAAAALQPAFATLVGAIDDDALLAQARALRQELLAAQPSWTRLSEIRVALSTAPGLAAATATFFADPAVRVIVGAAKLRFAEA